MFIISYKLPYEKLDATIELLAINDIYNVFYENPLEITTDNYGYGYLEKEDEEIILKVAFEGEKEGLDEFKDSLKDILKMDCSARAIYFIFYLLFPFFVIIIKFY